MKSLQALGLAVLCFVAAGCAGSHNSLPNGTASVGHPIIPLTTPSYNFHGCPVYNDGTAPDPYIEADITSFSADPQSGSVISSQNGNVHFSDISDDSALEIVNLATNSTVMFTVGTNGGHIPPITQGVHGGGPNAKAPWVTGFKIEGVVPPCPVGGDCHATTLNTDTCYVYEGGGWNYGVSGAASSLVAYNGLIDYLGDTYANQYVNKSDNWSVGGIPGMGTTDWGDDLTNANGFLHPVQVILPVSAVLNVANGVNYSPGVGNDGGCSLLANHCFEYGDILRLKSTHGCTADPFHPQIAKFMSQAKHYGWVVADTGSEMAIRLGLSTNGSDPWDSAVFTCLHTLSLSNDFDIISRTALVPPPSGSKTRHARRRKVSIAH